MAINMKEQRFGIEIEMTGITREEAARALAKLWHGNENEFEYEGGSYMKYTIVDPDGKTWTLAYDSSIYAESIIQDTSVNQYRTELVSPILTYGEIEKLQEAIRAIRKWRRNGSRAKVNDSCGIHVHVDAAPHSAKSLKNLLYIWYSKEDLIYKALDVAQSREIEYCRKIKDSLIDNVQATKDLTMDKLADIWYSQSNSPRSSHYNNTRYAALNFHNVWYRGTVEFRCFNSSLHAGEAKAYIQFCLAVSAQAINQRSAQSKKTITENDKFTFRTWLLRMGLIGDEFETARLHLLKKLDGNSAWRYDPNTYACNQ